MGMRIETRSRQRHARPLRRLGRIDLKVAAALALALALALAGAVALAIAWNAVGGRARTSDAAAAASAGPSSALAVATPAEREGVVPMREAAASSTFEANAASNAASNAAAPASAPASAPGTAVPAAWSLADSRVAGDDRAPPIQRSADTAPTPAWQLDDHQGYARREQDRHQATQRAFVDAADRELPRLDQQIEQGRAMGLPPEQLAKGEEKRRRIAEMRARMQTALAASDAAP